VDIGNSGGVLFSGAGGVSANIIQNSVEAMVEEGSVVTTTNGEVALSATDDSTIDAQAWGFGFSFTVRQNASVSMGFGITLNTIGNVVQSQVDDATVSAGEGVSLKASSVPTITSLEVAAAISVNFNSKNVSGAVAAAGAGGKNVISNTIEASITGDSSVTTHNAGAVEIEATDDANIAATATAISAAVATSAEFAVAVSLSGTFAEKHNFHPVQAII